MIRQGHAYEVPHYGKVIALESGDQCHIKCLMDREFGFEVTPLDSSDMTPLPMRYFHGEIPVEPETVAAREKHLGGKT